MHVGREQGTAMVSLNFLKNDLEKINKKLRLELQKLPNQFLP